MGASLTTKFVQISSLEAKGPEFEIGQKPDPRPAIDFTPQNREKRSKCARVEHIWLSKSRLPDFSRYRKIEVDFSKTQQAELIFLKNQQLLPSCYF